MANAVRSYSETASPRDPRRAPRVKSKQMSHHPLIEFENVTIVRNGRTALDGISFSIEHGQNTAVLGPNGCGKSTLVKSISGDLRPYAGRGRVRVGGFSRWNLFDLRKVLGIVSNDLQALCSKEVSALDVVISGFFGSYGELRPYDVSPEQIDKAKQLLEFLDAAHLADRFANELSSGESRRVLIARALVHDPRALLLDEPTTSLDIKSAALLIETLRKVAAQKMDLVLVTHHVEEIVPEVHRVVLLKLGKVFMDGPSEIVMTSKNLSDLYETPIRLERTCGVYHARLEAKA